MPRAAQDNPSDDSELRQLQSAPSGTFPPVPPLTITYELPLGELPWEDFERLCERLARVECVVKDARRYGRSGQRQYGIDIYGQMPGGRYRVWQCRQYSSRDKIDIRAAVEDFLGGPWAERAESFTFCTSLVLDDVPAEEDVVHARTVLASREPAIEFELWDGRQLSHMLKEHPRVVLDFLGPEHHRRFSEPERLDSSGQSQLTQLGELAASRGIAQVRFVSLAGAPAAIQSALEQLQQAAPGDLIALLGFVGETQEAGRAEQTIANWPPLLDSCDPGVLVALALLAERDGAWTTASQAWEIVASRASSSDAAADHTIKAAVAAKVAGDAARHSALLAHAKGLSPDHPRVVLEQIRDDAAPADRVDLLRDLNSDDPAVQAQIKSSLAVGYLLMPDLHSARQALAAVPEGAGDSVALRATKLNIVIQEGRLDTLDERPVNGEALREARIDALALRDELLSQRRHEESARLLMLAVDGAMLLSDRHSALHLLARRRDAEVKSETGATVLAALALRIGDPESGIAIIDQAGSTAMLRPMRAAAVIEAGRSAEIPEAVASLDETIATGGPDAVEAALFRLAATLTYTVRIDWSEPAEDLLTEAGHERAAVIARAFHVVRRHADYEGAYTLLDEKAPEPWALSTKLTLAQRQRKWSVLREAARRMLAAGPGQKIRVECGRALAAAGDVEDATIALLAVARDSGAPDVPRAAAYFLLTRIAGWSLDDWSQAGKFHDDWARRFPSDTRASAMAPTIARRRPR